ncbi:hypothetical protein FQA39_LY18314 [Lamprigera yunnana]|nr:hypothetical protein FQA39_LY18314 [Lamprigera yunnana]
MSVDKFGRLPQTGVHTNRNRIEDLILRLNQLESPANDDIDAIIAIILTAITSNIDAVFKVMFDENPHLTRFTSMEAAFRHILNCTAEIESTAAITAHIFSILVAKFSEERDINGIIANITPSMVNTMVLELVRENDMLIADLKTKFDSFTPQVVSIQKEILTKIPNSIKIAVEESTNETNIITDDLKTQLYNLNK